MLCAEYYCPRLSEFDLGPRRTYTKTFARYIAALPRLISSVSGSNRLAH